MQEKLIMWSTHLELVDAIADWNKLVCSPDETVHLDGLDTLLQLVHWCFVIPGLNVQENRGLCDEGRLLRLLGCVGGNSLLLDAFGFFVIFLVRSEEIDIVVIVSGGLGSSSRLGSISTALRELLAA